MIAVLIATVDPGRFLSSVLHTGIGLGPTGEAVLVDRNATVQAELKHDLPGGVKGVPLENRIHAKPARIAAMGRESVVIAPDYRGVPVLAATRRIRFGPDIRWGLVVKRDLSDVTAGIRQMLIDSMFFILSASLVAILIIGAVSRQISRPIRELSRAAKRVAAGDLSVAAKVSTQDEIGYLASVFNNMIGQIREWTEKLESKVISRTAELTRANEALMAEIAERERVEEELRFRALMLDRAYDSIFVCDEAENIVYANETAWRARGYSREEFLSLKRSAFVTSEGSSDPLDTNNVIVDSNGAVLESIHRTKDGGEIHVESYTRFVDVGGKRFILDIARDITSRKHAEEELRRLNRALRTISDCNQILVRAEDESWLLKNICRIIVERGGYSFAWAGYACNDDAKSVRPVARFGAGEGYLDALRISWADVPEGQGPTGKAIRFGKPMIVQDMNAESDYTAWREAARRFLFVSSVALPIFEDSKVIGALNIYSSESHAFDDEEMQLLVELADDLSFGVRAIRTREEHRRAEEALLRSEDRLLEAQRMARIGNWELDLTSNTLLWSDEIYRIFEIDRTDFGASYEAFLAAIHPDDRDAVNAAYTASLTTKQPYDIVHRLLMRDGRVKFVRERCETAFDPEGAPLRSVGTVQDITEEKKAEEALKAALADSRRRAEEVSALLSISNAVIESPDFLTAARKIFDACRGLIGATAGYVALLSRDGRENEVLLLESGGAPCTVDASLPMPIRGLREQAYASGRPVCHNDFMNSEWPRLLPGGHMAIRNVLFVPLQIQGEPLGLIGFANKPSDFTDRDLRLAASFGELASLALQSKKALASLKDSEERYRNLVDNTPDIIASFDRDARITAVNRGASLTFSMPPQETIGKTMEELAFPEDYVRQWRFLHQRALEGDTIVDETFLSMPGAKTRTYETIVTPLRDGNGDVVGVTGVSRDVTERIQSQIERDKLQEELVQSQKMETIGRLAGGIAHDYNNVLTSIMGHAQLGLRKTAAGDFHHRAYLEIQKAGLRARDLTMNLLTFARKEKAHLRKIQVSHVVDDLVAILSRSVSKKIEISATHASGLPPISGDANQLHLAFLNICNNACDAMPNGGKLAIDVSHCGMDDLAACPIIASRDGFCRVCVRDNGTGMTEYEKSKIFEPFFTTKPIGKGTGLGLSTTYGIIKNHNGFIEVFSDLGEGTVVNVYLPVASGTADASGEEREGEIAMSKGSETILIVDDEKPVLDIAEMMLKEAGYDVVLAAGGKEAVRIFKRRHDDITLVVLDFNMPEMDGSDVYHAMKKIDPDVKAILCSGFSAEGRAGQLLSEGVRGFIQKPFDFATLCEGVRNAIDADPSG